MVFCHKKNNMARLKRLVLVVDENAVNQVLKMLTAIAELSQRKIEVASEDEIEAMSEKEDAVMIISLLKVLRETTLKLQMILSISCCFRRKDVAC